MTCKHCDGTGERWSEALEEMRACFCQPGSDMLTDVRLEKALAFAVGFMGGFEGDVDQAGLDEALCVLRTAQDQGYRLVRAR
ncbi:hypothetical protein [Niveispirillum fermenti]|uniref:hypothetical protein n=1 Tax=Niveispirillum fermenti TaxID=1233113 RepID=UPI003A898987